MYVAVILENNAVGELCNVSFCCNECFNLTNTYADCVMIAHVSKGNLLNIYLTNVPL